MYSTLPTHAHLTTIHLHMCPTYPLPQQWCSLFQQVDALAALMEGIRGVDPGQLSTSLFDQCFTLLITSSTVHPRTLAAFLSSYCGLRDVQYAAMKCISSLCAGYREHRDGGGSVGGGVGVGGGGGVGSGEEGDTNKQGTKHTKNKKGTKQNGNSAGAAAAAGQGGGDAVAGTQAATGTQVDGTVLPVHDIARNVYDVLMHVYEHAFADSGGDDGEGPGVQYKVCGDVWGVVCGWVCICLHIFYTPTYPPPTYPPPHTHSHLHTPTHNSVTPTRSHLHTHMLTYSHHIYSDMVGCGRGRHCSGSKQRRTCT